MPYTLKLDWDRDRIQAVLDALFTGDQLLAATQLVQVGRDLIPQLPADSVTLKLEWPTDLIEAVVIALEEAAQTEWSVALREEVAAAAAEIRGYRETAEAVIEMLAQEGTVVTANGTVLTDADIQELADEAERGYNPSKLKPPSRLRPRPLD